MFQSLDEVGSKHVERIVLTASGGPFRTWTRSSQQTRSRHTRQSPTGRMTITMDSATMVDQAGTDEAFIFWRAHNQLSAIIHPQSIIHALILSTMARSSLASLTRYADADSLRLGYPAQPPGVRCETTRSPPA